ncbi:MAG: MerR family transcriptional regulator [Aquabacterium sp.]|nr:MAG: MerR family transcriptional regulator [Aquabacterium sp.]
MERGLPPIPAKRYFTIGEVSALCSVKPYVLRYWEQEFIQLKPMKRRGNRRYYQHHEVLLIRRIRELLYDQGFTISGARNRLTELGLVDASGALQEPDMPAVAEADTPAANQWTVAEAALKADGAARAAAPSVAAPVVGSGPLSIAQVREELLAIRSLLG